MEVYRTPDPPATSWECSSRLYVREKQDAAAVSSAVRVAPLRLHGGMWITTQAQPLLNYPSCLAFRAGPLASKSESAGGTFCSWIANRAFCGGVRDAGPLDGSSLAGRGAGPRGGRVEGGYGGKGHSLDGAPLARGELVQPLHALRGTLVAHVQPQGLMGLAVVHYGLLVPVEGQRAHLVRHLWMDRKKKRNY